MYVSSLSRQKQLLDHANCITKNIAKQKVRGSYYIKLQNVTFVSRHRFLIRLGLTEFDCLPSSAT